MMVRRLAYVALLTIGAAVVAALGLAAGRWPPLPATASGLLGLPLTPDVTEEQVMVERHSFGAYRAYVRFALSPADLPVLLSDPAFQRVAPHGGPLTIFDNAQIGRTPVGEQVLRGRPAWWQPEQASALTLAYRSPPGPDAAYTGPDAAWYLIDTSDTARVVVYAYVLEE